MKSLLALTLTLCATAANAHDVLAYAPPIEDSGLVEFIDWPCKDGGRVAVSVDQQGRVMQNGCWTSDDTLISVLWQETGDTLYYNREHVFLTRIGAKKGGVWPTT